MNNEPSSATKLEWVTCPWDATTFQIAVPARTMEIRPSAGLPMGQHIHYCMEVNCPKCNNHLWIETNLPYFMQT